MCGVPIPLVVELVLSASYIQSSIICLSLPLDLFPSMFSSITVFNSDSPLRLCPIHFFCLVFIVRMRDLSSPIVSNISSFVLCSVQLTFSILLQVHISKASSLLCLLSSLSMFLLHIYSTGTLHISVFIIRIFNVLFTFTLKSSLFFKNTSFPIVILLLISLWHLASVVITLLPLLPRSTRTPQIAEFRQFLFLRC